MGKVTQQAPLNLHDIIQILSDEGILFKAGILDFGEDTDFGCIEFCLSEDFYSFNYYLDVDTHGHTIEGGSQQWFYSPKDKSEFLELIKTGHIEDEK